MPKPPHDHLPEDAQAIHREAFNDALEQCAHDPYEESAHRVAWSEAEVPQAGNRWLPNA